MRDLVIGALLLGLTTPAIRAADAAFEGPEQKVLDRWLGQWRSTYKVFASEWNPVEKTLTADATGKRVLGGRFVQDSSEHSDKSSGLSLITYEAEKKTYRSWWFSSAGHTSESTGRWDEAVQTMTWTSVDKSAPTTTVKQRFTSDDRVEWDVTVKDHAGKVLFRMEGVSERLKAVR